MASYIQTCHDVLYLASCAVNNRIPDKSRIHAMDLDAVFHVAQRHLVRAIVAVALESAGVKDKQFTEGFGASLRKTVIFADARKKVLAELDKAGIWYLPLKGMVLKDYYPKTGMREMSDHDILIDATRAVDVKDIMESLGFETEQFGWDNPDVYFKKPVLNFEMHTTLFTDFFNPTIADYYRNVKERLVRESVDSCGYHFTKEDFYIYITAHEYKHFSGGGTGIRSLIDTYLYLKKETLEMDYIRGEIKKLGLSDFEERNRNLSLHLFDGEKLTNDDKQMLEYILNSGAYGTLSHRVQNRIREKEGNKIAYMWSRFAVPIRPGSRGYDEYSKVYPFFYKYKILLPFLPLYRLGRAFRKGVLKQEIRAVRKAKK